MFHLLADLKIIDLTTIVLGPYATQILGDFGAQVTKIESLEGDLFRAVRPGRRDDLGVQFQNFNRNKRSMALNLKSDAARGNPLSAGQGCGRGRSQHAQSFG